MASLPHFSGEEVFVKGVKIKRIGNSAFRCDLEQVVGRDYEDQCFNRIYLKTSDISQFKDTVELEPKLFACKVIMHNGSDHLVFGTAQFHADRYEQTYQDEPDSLMRFEDANGAVDMYQKVATGEVELIIWACDR